MNEAFFPLHSQVVLSHTRPLKEPPVCAEALESSCLRKPESWLNNTFWPAGPALCFHPEHSGESTMAGGSVRRNPAFEAIPRGPIHSLFSRDENPTVGTDGLCLGKHRGIGSPWIYDCLSMKGVLARESAKTYLNDRDRA
jgi:hypothetical protein